MDASKLIEALEDAGYEPRSYSGRGMYGRECVGVVTSGASFRLGAEVAKSAAYLADDEEEAQAVLCDLAELSVATDAMGFDTIVYFPGVDWPEGLSREDEEDEAAA
jgi:hypothetical protein